MPERGTTSPEHSGQPEVSLVIPVYNEEQSLPPLAAEIRDAMRPLGKPYEVLFVDDGSDDGSLAVLARLAREDPAIRVLRQARNSGQSAALDAGFRHARGAVVVTLDADLQNDPADIPRLLERLAGCDLVCGVRARRRDSWIRRLSSGVANGVRNRLTHESVADVGCTLKAFRAEHLRRLAPWNGMHRFLPTLLRMEGARVAELPVNHRPRRYGQPKYNIRNRLWRATADLFAVRWMQSRWIDRGQTEEIEIPGSAAADAAASAAAAAPAAAAAAAAAPAAAAPAASEPDLPMRPPSSAAR